MPFPTAIQLRAANPASSWNFTAQRPGLMVTFDARTRIAIATDRDGVERFRSADPFAALGWMHRFDLAATPKARWIGYIGYEFARETETLPATARDDQGLSTFVFALCERQPSVSTNDDPSPIAETSFGTRSFSRGDYLNTIARAIDYIAAGDVFQVNLAQRLSFTTKRTADAIWRALPVQDYGALLDFGTHAIISNSPELFFRIEPQADGSRRIVNRPIKGTRPLLPGMDDELRASAKDRAELAMIVDLQRNDLGRVCEIGSVHVTEPRAIEAAAGVYHGVATIEGTLRRKASFADVIRALFPCGSVTGCPKIRAMQIIDELEPVGRGPYCGAIGYLDATGRAEFNVAIRTMIKIGDVVHVYVGGGIVADSTPQAEYDETIVKARTMLDALGVDPSNIDQQQSP